MRRVLLLLALLSLAFAPAPFPKPPGAKGSLAVKNLVGTWRIAAIYHYPNRVPREPARAGATHVTITATGWEFKGSAAASYELRLDPTKQPAELDFIRPGQGTPHGRGLIRREGRALRVIYQWGSSRPTGFESQPKGCELLLERE
jgi:uncharacterized protein (TIGR03067 family)